MKIVEKCTGRILEKKSRLAQIWEKRSQNEVFEFLKKIGSNDLAGNGLKEAY